MSGTATRLAFGTLADGRMAEAVELYHSSGLFVRVLAFGATLQSFCAPDRDGRFADIVLGYDGADLYEAQPQFFGASVGRYANRIAGARFELDGRAVTLEANDGANHLHGGRSGFDRRLWEIAGIEQGETPAVVLRRISPDGEGGYPGTLETEATYRLTGPCELTVTYRATSDAPTIVNLTNHAFFNLHGATAGRSALDHDLRLDASRFLPVDGGWIPTGEMRDVAGTPFDFRDFHTLGERLRDGRDAQMRVGRGYDHDFVLDGPSGGAPRRAATLREPASGRRLTLSTTEPGLQVYSGNYLDATVTGKGGTIYRQGDGLCLEPQRHPDTPNQPALGSARLSPGETYRHVSVYDVTPA
ncbi:aldose epimerase family protein [Aurantimonas sp. Leaf443]|uniref:aldose epimerase family protein n=1 Tax=Aurantimonas sp. Leaf443 TaxID=1736378 RepID=UPI000701F706|nr:aldose epimerase family protein [Aurantimonas sp. Leaf443]KQT88187.1 aldose epimerase [Aurantimonas sp. Leaf443]